MAIDCSGIDRDRCRISQRSFFERTAFGALASWPVSALVGKEAANNCWEDGYSGSIAW
ncbi:hypothetical protein Q5692_07005 [Microcoleus sp. C2C3]|uniref:hypothetical protein n=1 Tax=unclassified Microcoleus TaxID=2642155 RepID=UPI002FD1D49C